MSASPAPNLSKQRGDLRFIIIGAGMAGILSAIKLKEAGYGDFVIYEKAESLGGTWRENTYAGIACDVPSHLYSYSFAQNPEWSQRYSPGAEILEYFDGVAQQFGVKDRIRFGLEVESCSFEKGRWGITLSDGSTDVADFVIAATGVLHHPAYPDIEGLDRFEGASFHSARWDDSVPLEGKRVGVIGTGSSAIQIASALVDQVAELKLFQRTAQWVFKVENPAYSSEEKQEFRRRPESMKEIRADVAKQFVEGFANILVDMNSPLLDYMEDLCRANLEDNIKDPELLEKLRPTYKAACKRLVMSTNFYEQIQKPNAHVVTETIEKAESGGLRTADGALHELDVLILATGFQVDRFVRPIDVKGRNGLALDDLWKDGATAYLAITVPDMPNFFMLNGPNGPVGNFSLIDVAEMQFAYFMQLVERVRSGECNEICVSREAMDRFDADRREAAKSTIWASGCKSWYLDASGLPTAWPWTFDRFVEAMSTPREADFDAR